MELVLLGTGAGSGVPAFYCGCRACREAVRDSFHKRTRCAVSILNREVILIDAPVELASQLSREGINKVGYLFLTHSHYDHVGGLGDLEFYVRLKRKSALPAFMSQETWEQLQTSYGYMIDCLSVNLIEPKDVFEVGKVHLTALEASHAPGTLGFIIEHDSRCIGYLPDTGPLPEKTRRRLRGIERLVLDSTYWGRNLYPEQHLSFSEAVAIGQELEVEQLYLTHMAMHYDKPVTNRELEQAIKPYGQQVHLAYDGLRLTL